MVQPGEKFGNYQISGDDSGKMAIFSETADSITVRGEHIHLGTPAAIKVIHHPGQAKEAFAEEVRVASATAGLSHPHIARVLDFGTHEDRLYRAMEWCEGGGVESFIAARGGVKDERDLQQWFFESAGALGHAHRQNIVHRDLKPSNLLMAKDRDGAVIKIVDFGFAGGVEGNAGEFAPPEGETISAASDVYSLAAVFAHLLGSEVSSEIGPLFPPGLDPRWKRLLTAMLSLNPAARPEDGSAVLEMFRAEFPDFVSTPVPWDASSALERPSQAMPPPPPQVEIPPPVPPVEAAPPPEAVVPPLPPIEEPPSVRRELPPPVPPSQPPPIPPPAPPAARKGNPVAVVLILILIFLSLVAAGGIVGWRHFKAKSKELQAAIEASTPEVKEASEKPASSPLAEVDKPHPSPVAATPASEAVSKTSVAAEPPPAPAPAAPEIPQPLRVPGDATTIGGALARCPDGGTIEVNGGTYRESLLITRPVTILASGDAALEDNGKSSTLLIVKGDIAVSIRGLVVRNPQKQGAGNPEEAAALMLIASNAKVKMEKCLVEGGQGDGMTIADHGQAELTECRVMKNRGFGTRISGGSQLTVIRGTIQENGLGGAWVANTGSRLSLNEGGTVNRNSNNGIQATEGAVVEINGGGVSFNRTNGVIALDAGTRVEVKETGLISDNGVNGIAMVNGAAVSISSAKIERNQNYGVLAEKSGKLALSGAILRSNSMAGVFFNEGGGQSCRIERSEFSDHSEFGAAFVGGDIFVNGCTFSENGGALLLGKDTKGQITNNSISPGPITSAIVREGAGEVKEENNTIR
jgi:serine/threonine-protein kinase